MLFSSYGLPLCGDCIVCISDCVGLSKITNTERQQNIYAKRNSCIICDRRIAHYVPANAVTSLTLIKLASPVALYGEMVSLLGLFLINVKFIGPFLDELLY
jgi:hypothetical protein